jgi:hypothetical protein
MSYAELIQQRLQSLSPAQQAEVFDFVEFLASRKAATQAAQSTAQNPPPRWLGTPFEVPGFTPMSREEANARE